MTTKVTAAAYMVRYSMVLYGTTKKKAIKEFEFREASGKNE